MKQEEQRAIIASARDMDDHYDFIGIKAYHLLGDLSRDFVFKDIKEELKTRSEIVENMFHASKETDDYYIGAWHTGFGFFNVLFPKETSRPLTENELKICSEYYAQINSQPPFKHVVKTKSNP